MTLEEISIQIEKNTNPIRIKGLLKKREEPLKEFLIKFLTTWVYEKDTVWVSTGLAQCHKGARRSINDLFLISKHYYPETTLKEVAQLLFIEFPTSLKGFSSSYCPTIMRRVFKVYPNHLIIVEGKIVRDQFSLTWDEWRYLLK